MGTNISLANYSITCPTVFVKFFYSDARQQQQHQEDIRQ